MKDLDKFLNIASEDIVEVSLPATVSQQPQQTAMIENQIADDFDFARDNLYDIIGKGTEALEELVNIASQSQSPRDYEVLGTMINTLVTANKSLLEMQKKKKELIISAAPEAAQNITNNLFVGSTAELQKFITDRKKTNE
jgi:hypothetical protein